MKAEVHNDEDQVQEEDMQGVRRGLLPPFPAERRDRRMVQTQVLR